MHLNKYNLCSMNIWIKKRALWEQQLQTWQNCMSYVFWEQNEVYIYVLGI